MQRRFSSSAGIYLSLRRFPKTFAGFVGWLLLATTLAGPVSAREPAVVHGAEARSPANPVLASFGVSAADLPAELFLVRTRGELPHVAGVVIHATRAGLFLVSGDRDAVLALAQEGCAVIPVPAFTTATRSPGRMWTPLDTPDPDIAAMVTQVAWTGVSAKIQWLVDFGTRHSYASNHFTVADAIGDVLASYGLNVVLRPFTYSARTLWNVEATQLGTVTRTLSL